MTARGILVATAIALAFAAPASAQAPVEIKSSTPGQPKQFELITPGGPATREKSRVPDADFYGDDQRVPYDPALIEPFVGTTKNGSKYGASLWTSPQTPVGSLASQGYQQGGSVRLRLHVHLGLGAGAHRPSGGRAHPGALSAG